MRKRLTRYWPGIKNYLHTINNNDILTKNKIQKYILPKLRLNASKMTLHLSRYAKRLGPGALNVLKLLREDII